MEDDLNKIIENMNSYAKFVALMEAEIPSQSEKFSHLWTDAEIINANALNEWGESGEPFVWLEWDRKYKHLAKHAAKSLLEEYHMVNSESDYIDKKITQKGAYKELMKLINEGADYNRISKTALDFLDIWHEDNTDESCIAIYELAMLNHQKEKTEIENMIKKLIL